ncbi:MAG: hypothetical protein WCO02_12520 [Bacteroidota bacterium]
MKRTMNKLKSIGWTSVIMITLVIAMGLGTESCKSTGKMSKKERKAQIEVAKKELGAIIAGTSGLSLAQQEKQVNDIINKKLNDPTVNGLVVEAQQAIKKAYAERDKLHQQKIDAAKAELNDMLQNKDGKSAADLQTQLNAIKAQNLNDPEITDLIAKVQVMIDGMNNKPSLPMKTQLENAFQGIADAAQSGNLTQADNLIKNTLQYFTDPDAPVLIIIYRQGATVDYDKPTTIQRYLNFCKDQKKSMNAVDAIQQEATGKIKELDLIKK